MASTPEGRLQKKIKERLEKAFPQSFWFKTHGGAYQRAGLPDLIGCVNGKFVGVEVKVPGKERTLTKLQQHTINLIIGSNGLAFMSTDPEDAITTIESWLKENS